MVLAVCPVNAPRIRAGTFRYAKAMGGEGQKKRRLENGALFLLTHERLRVREKSVLLLGEKMR